MYGIALNMSVCFAYILNVVTVIALLLSLHEKVIKCILTLSIRTLYDVGKHSTYHTSLHHSIPYILKVFPSICIRITWKKGYYMKKHVRKLKVQIMM